MDQDNSLFYSTVLYTSDIILDEITVPCIQDQGGATRVNLKMNILDV